MNDPEQLECLNGHDGKCQGSVEYRTSGSSMRGWPRCAYHGDVRQAQATNPNSMEYYADSDVPPAWFDPADAGETW